MVQEETGLSGSRGLARTYAPKYVLAVDTFVSSDAPFDPKNIGTTHITNGCYRLHPVEWNIGEAAGALAAQALAVGRAPRSIQADPVLLRSFQRSLLEEGVPLAWLIDVGVDHPAFAASQRAFMSPGFARDGRDLLFRPNEPISAREWSAWGGRGDLPATRAIAAARLATMDMPGAPSAG